MDPKLIRIKAPDFYHAEHEYVFFQLFKMLCDIDFEVTYEQREDYLFETVWGATLSIPCIFFNEVASFGYRSVIANLSERHLNRVSLEINESSVELTVIFGKGEFSTDVRRQSRLSIDVVGGAFMLLSQAEEVFSHERDGHGRFGFAQSCLSEVVYDFPVVDEYAELIRLWFGLSVARVDCQPHKSNVVVSTDVDFISDWRTESAVSAVKATLKSFKVYRGLPIQDHFGAIFGYLNRLLRRQVADPFQKGIANYLEVLSKYNIVPTAYFIPCRTSNFDGDCLDTSAALRRCLLEFQDLNAQVGVHPGYACHEPEVGLLPSISAFKTFHLDSSIHCRFHFLKWEAAKTAYLLSLAGVAEDSTLGFADRAGFRAGTAHKFYLYDWARESQSTITEQPLICMDATILRSEYEAHGFSDAAVQRITELARRSTRFGGKFTLLWHNTEIDTDFKNDFFDRVMREIIENSSCS
jgi:hypothetical protein